MDSPTLLKKYLLYSLSFHLVVLLFFWILTQVTPDRPIQTTQVTMIRLTRGTSLEGNLFKEAAKGSPTAIPKTKEVPTPKTELPKKPETKTEIQKPNTQIPKPKSQTPSPKSQVPNPKTSTLKPPTPKPKTPSVNETKISEALGEVQQELKSREAQQQSVGTEENPGLPDGTGDSRVPVFGSPQGGISAQDPAYVQYQATVRAKIIREWIQSGSGAQETAYRCRIKVKIDAGGSVISKAVIKKSGNESFDLSALRAIERASPLPAPPPLLKGEALQDGLVIDFSSKTR